FFPSRAAGEISVAVVKRHGGSADSVCNSTWQTGPVDEAHFHRRQSAGARREYCLARNTFKLQRLSVGVQRQSAFQTIGLPGEIWRKTRIAGPNNQSALLNFLEGRDFRHVDYVIELDVARSRD